MICPFCQRGDYCADNERIVAMKRAAEASNLMLEFGGIAEDGHWQYPFNSSNARNAEPTLAGTSELEAKLS